MGERDRSAKFEEIAERRVNEAIRRIRLIGNLSNRSNYAYTEEHSKQIVRALEVEIRELKDRFLGNGEKHPLFKFQLRSMTIDSEGSK